MSDGIGGFQIGISPIGGNMYDTYISQTQLLLNDINGQFFTTSQLLTWINIARNRIAAEAQCCRVLSQGGAVSGLTLVSSGSGYTSPTVTIAAPTALGGIQATALPTVVGGVITAVTLVNPGIGYGSAPTVTVTDSTGSGAAITTAVNPPVNTVAGQEQYLYSQFSGALTAINPGVSSIMAIQSISISWGSTKPTLQYLDFTAFQAFCRSYSQSINTYPLVWNQYQQGSNGSFFLWPFPNQPMIMDLDCYCLPVPLVSNATPEAIPYPWTDTVPYYAAYYAYLRAQNPDMARMMMSEVRRTLPENRMFSTPSRIPDMYGEY